MKRTRSNVKPEAEWRRIKKRDGKKVNKDSWVSKIVIKNIKEIRPQAKAEFMRKSSYWRRAKHLDNAQADAGLNESSSDKRMG